MYKVRFSDSAVKQMEKLNKQTLRVIKNWIVKNLVDTDDPRRIGRPLKGNLSGIVCNCRNVDNEEEIVNEFAKRIGTHVVGTIHRSNLIQDAELDAKTVVEKYPESEEAQEYMSLASSIMSNENISTPEPMDDEEFEEFFKSYL